MIYITSILQYGSTLLFCLSMALLILPHIFIWIFYTLPQSVHFSVLGKIYGRSILPTIVKLLSWLAIVALLYTIAFISDPIILADLLYGPIALFCWGVAVINILRLIFFRHTQFQDEFYEKIYLQFIKPDFQQEYDDYISLIKDFTFSQLISERKIKLDYLQRKAIQNRISFLENNPGERQRIESAAEMKAASKAEEKTI